MALTVAVGAGMRVSGCPCSQFSPEQAVGRLNHPKSTGIYNLNGSINEEKWSALLHYTETNDLGDVIITESQLYKFLDSCRKEDKRADFFGLAEQASNAEWAAYMQIFTEKNSQGIRFVKIKFLREFFEDSQTVGQEVEGSISKSL